jgi:predicted aspartyl protease
MTHQTTNDHVRTGLDRRRFLLKAGLAAGAGALPLLGAADTVHASPPRTPGHGTAGTSTPEHRPPAPRTPFPPADSTADPDQLFTSGQFAAAARGYSRLLRADPDNAHAAAQSGYIHLLSDRLERAEPFLVKALRLAPDDVFTRGRLANCLLRQDDYARAAPLLPEPLAVQAAAVTGTPFEQHGPPVTRVPFLAVDPLPQLEASVAGSAPWRFVLDTGAGDITLTTRRAEQAGLRAVASTTMTINGRPSTTYLGIAPSVRIGEIELRNVPVTWIDEAILAFPDGTVPDGTIGWSVFYRFLTTLDYRRKALVLRRKTPAQQREFRTEAARAGLRPQPMWLPDHVPCTPAKLNGYGPGIAGLDTGTIGAGLNTSVANAERAGITVDYAHPTPVNGGAATIYPITADRVSIGDAVGRHLPGSAGPVPGEGAVRFDLIGNITHEFFKPFAVTFDYAAMRLYVG